MKELIEHAKKVIAECPQLKDRIEETVQLAKDEIEAGESEDNEISLAISEINQMKDSP